jgi:hypothetical protein
VTPERPMGTFPSEVQVAMTAHLVTEVTPCLLSWRSPVLQGS